MLKEDTRRRLDPATAERATWNYCWLPGGRLSASVNCPDCGLHAGLDEHTIFGDGTVKPSLDCPRCGFHEFVRLEGWNAMKAREKRL